MRLKNGFICYNICLTTYDFEPNSCMLKVWQNQKSLTILLGQNINRIKINSPLVSCLSAVLILIKKQSSKCTNIHKIFANQKTNEMEVRIYLKI